METNQSVPAKTRSKKRTILWIAILALPIVIAVCTAAMANNGRERVKTPFGAIAYFEEVKPGQTCIHDTMTVSGKVYGSCMLVTDTLNLSLYVPEDWTRFETAALMDAMATRKKQDIYGWTEDELYTRCKEGREYEREWYKEAGLWGKDVGNSDYVYDDVYFDMCDQLFYMYLSEL